jgi:hypothetical protein
MTDAPETIWADKEFGCADWDAGTFCTVDDGSTSYTRTDHSQALIAAAYEAAWKGVKKHSDQARKKLAEAGTREVHDIWGAIVSHLDLEEEKICALTPADAQAALDKLIADAERRGMERAACEMDLAAHVMSHYGSALEVETYQSAASGIRAAMEDKKP